MSWWRVSRADTLIDKSRATSQPTADSRTHYAGFGSIVLADLLRGANSAPPTDLKPRAVHFPAQAKAVIQLVQNGGPSQMDLFDPKPILKRLAGQPLTRRRRDSPAEHCAAATMVR